MASADNSPKQEKKDTSGKRRSLGKETEQYLAELLHAPEPPSRIDYAEKKVVVARKMDRLDFAGKARLSFITLLHKNNEQKRRMITSFTDEKLGEVCNDGLRQAAEMFDEYKEKHAKMKSIPKRLKIIHDYCVNEEVQAAKGMLSAADLDPVPTSEIYDSIAFDSIIPSYQDYLDNKPSPFVPEEGEIRDPLSCVELLQPYMPPKPVMEKRKKLKDRARQQVADRKAAEEYEKKRSAFAVRERQMADQAKDSFGHK